MLTRVWARSGFVESPYPSSEKSEAFIKASVSRPRGVYEAHVHISVQKRRIQGECAFVLYDGFVEAPLSPEYPRFRRVARRPRNSGRGRALSTPLRPPASMSFKVYRTLPDKQVRARTLLGSRASAFSPQGRNPLPLPCRNIGLPVRPRRIGEPNPRRSDWLLGVRLLETGGFDLGELNVQRARQTGDDFVLRV